MRLLLLGVLVGLFFSACNQHKPAGNTASKNPVAATTDKEQITQLVRTVLNWKESKDGIQILPVLTDKKDSMYIGFDMALQETNLKKLSASNLFATEFIQNYDNIIRILGKKLKNKEYETWLVGDLPTFAFANDVDPWCLCQDVPYDKPNPWDLVEVTLKDISKDRATLTWTWGRSEWSKDFNYKARVTKENGKWKIAYLEGFDFQKATQ